jgi:hypothetical protein
LKEGYEGKHEKENIKKEEKREKLMNKKSVGMD